jgi:hypothetical protein
MTASTTNLAQAHADFGISSAARFVNEFLTN